MNLSMSGKQLVKHLRNGDTNQAACLIEITVVETETQNCVADGVCSMTPAGCWESAPSEEAPGI